MSAFLSHPEAFLAGFGEAYLVVSLRSPTACRACPRRRRRQESSSWVSSDLRGSKSIVGTALDRKQADVMPFLTPPGSKVNVCAPMPTSVLMPQLGESIAEARSSAGTRRSGDSVTRDEPLLEVSTDKVDAEIPSPAAGVLTEIRVREGETRAGR